MKFKPGDKVRVLSKSIGQSFRSTIIANGEWDILTIDRISGGRW